MEKTFQTNFAVNDPYDIKLCYTHTVSYGSVTAMLI